MAASKIFFDKKNSKTIPGQMLSTIINFINCGLTGVFLTYILSCTGKDKAVVKGAGVWTMLWILINGLLSKTVLKVKTKKPLSPFLSLFDHSFMGALNAFIIIKLGDGSLFSDKQVKKGEKLPLVATNQHSNNLQQTAEVNHRNRVRRHIVNNP